MSITEPPDRRSGSLRATAWLALVAVLPSSPGLVSFFVGDDFDFLVIMRRMQSAAECVELSFWGEWEPLWYLSFYLDYRLWGLDPLGYHVSSQLCLVLAVILLFALVRELWPEAVLAPWGAALLFATHPLHDEAVTYLAARGHPMSAALALLAVWLYVRSFRTQRAGRGVRVGLRVASLFVALLAALAKETALLLPAWIAALQFVVLGRARWSWRAVWTALRDAALFVLPGAAYLALRHLSVGLNSGKLAGPDRPFWDLVESFTTFLPDYALIGGVPLPFAFLDREAVGSWTPLGWIVAGAALLVPIYGIVRQMRRSGELTPGVGVYVLGLVIVVAALVPVFWADLGLKRRYFFVPSIGSALMVAAVLEWVAMRRVILARAVLLLLVAGSGLGLLQRNELYRQAGRTTRSLVESVRGAPLGQPVDRHRRSGEAHRVALLTLPRYLGGDGLSGAYVLHRTDARSAVRLAGVEPKGFSVALQTEYAEDYVSEARFENRRVLDLDVSFRTQRAYRSSRERDPSDDRSGKFVRVTQRESGAGEKSLRYRVVLSPEFAADPAAELYLYSRGRFRRVLP